MVEVLIVLSNRYITLYLVTFDSQNPHVFIVYSHIQYLSIYTCPIIHRYATGPKPQCH